MPNNPATILDIAKRLNLSKSTVSRALRDHPDISQTTKEAVRRVAEELSYMPNAVAASFRYKRSKVIGLIVPQISYFFFPSVIRGIEEIVYKNGYNLLILQSNESFEREKENLNILVANNVEGILVSVSRKTKDFSHFKHLIDRDYPLVFFDRVVTDLEADCVLVDDVTASFNAVNHLIDRGRKKIGICTGNLNLLISQNRLKGYKMALQHRNYPVTDDYIVSCEWPDEAEKRTMELLNTANPPDAIFAISDLTMSGVMKAIFRKGLKVPEQIAVIGFCEETFRTMYNPPLSVIHPMGFEIGQASAELLFERINNNAREKIPYRTVYLEGTLEIGGST
ncbi:LacI family DNA-binding transcriptional regulator [Mangrovibacterium marinum]|uniref:LacI family transcriptional regulator n=1 Tax=Mangrovibacterium marinum TaxID=1639118 RepID=A0A2T5C4T6_9BACT|nr:LacI family DNA-binding transcriptional regulator [Mangrovibacterium marinum]PTN09870.1 LacI family transcriptional regulator [Mangrovibacterium marinum]